MLKRMLLGMLLGLLTGCASLKDPEPPVCDGHHRRPANPYGSVLDGAAPPAPSSTSLERDDAARIPSSEGCA